jgi:hypothetical protein
MFTRKIQLGALAVIVNGLLALTVLAPQAAEANPCNGIFKCDFCFTSPSQCQPYAPPGCTVTSVQCVQGACAGNKPGSTCLFN